jgi:hypothetical protein
MTLTINWFLLISIPVATWCYCTGRVDGWTLTLIVMFVCKVTTTHKFKI